MRRSSPRAASTSSSSTGMRPRRPWRRLNLRRDVWQGENGTGRNGLEGIFYLSAVYRNQRRGFEGKHSSVGERSMLGVFQEVAVRLADIPVGGVATFDQMFEGIRTALKSNVQQSILIAEKNRGQSEEHTSKLQS